MPWSRGRRPVMRVVHTGGPSVGRTVASGPKAPRRARRAKAGTPAAAGDAGEVRRREAVDAHDDDPPRGPARVELDGRRRSRGRGLRPEGQRHHQGRGRREDREGRRERALVAREERHVEADGEEDGGGPGHHHRRGGEGVGASRGAARAGSRGGCASRGRPRPTRATNASEAKNGRPAITGRKGRGHQRSGGGGGRHARRGRGSRPPPRAGRGQAEGRRLVAQDEAGVEVERERRQAGGPDRGGEDGARERLPRHAPTAYPNGAVAVDARPGARVSSAGCPPTGSRRWSRARRLGGPTSCSPSATPRSRARRGPASS